VRGPLPPRDQTVNRAFSRRFFEIMGVAPARRAGSGPVELERETITGSLVLADEEILEADAELEEVDGHELPDLPELPRDAIESTESIDSVDSIDSIDSIDPAVSVDDEDIRPS
jgi:hypothetical protein